VGRRGRREWEGEGEGSGKERGRGVGKRRGGEWEGEGEGSGKERVRDRDQSTCIYPADSTICFLCTFLLSQMEEERLGMYMTSDASTLKRSSRAGVQQQPAALPQSLRR